ncbi:hypothetical protein [Vagococcus fessus]|uniref:Uncharacterized protein n=1 Tax=Vagococcus fessus TaxID=120370 RepID=A0A430A8V5_9ENTE|nr:hypothetical protein [Vagococcus fessus]RSU03517.1 hypothetical protein CBF31_07335 [Vagococcus fessus]
MFDYQEYLEKGNALSFEEALEMYNKIHGSADSEDEDFNFLWSSVIEAASDYVKKRNDWLTYTIEQKQQMDASRTAQHNAFMATLQPLARYMTMKEWDATWYDTLINVDHERQKQGDFAGYLLCIGCIKAR